MLGGVLLLLCTVWDMAILDCVRSVKEDMLLPMVGLLVWLILYPLCQVATPKVAETAADAATATT